MALHTFQPGEVIFREGDASQDAYFLVDGRVEISIETADGGSRSLGQIHPGEIFGEMGMINDRPRSATATAVDQVHAESFGETLFEELVLKQPDRLHTYLATLFERLRTTDLLLQRELRKQSKDGAPKAVEPSAVLSEAAADSEVTDDSPASGEGLTLQLKSCYTRKGRYEPEIDMPLDKLPFRIGRAFEDSKVAVFARNDLSIPDQQPYHLSRNHCEIVKEGDSYFVRDRGSNSGTLVNGTLVHMHAGEIHAPLKMGENELIFGSAASPHKYLVTVA